MGSTLCKCLSLTDVKRGTKPYESPQFVALYKYMAQGYISVASLGHDATCMQRCDLHASAVRVKGLDPIAPYIIVYKCYIGLYRFKV